MKNSILFLLLLCGFAGISQNQTAKLTEEQKISQLIDYVRKLDGAKFIRNGSEHSASEAADHLAMKRKKAGKRVKTAVEFIVYCASKSSMSGKDYTVRMKDGKIVKTIDLLSTELKRIELANK